ncbi:MAG: cytochrome c biogenesis protein CcsA [Candidatus Bathyarchaeota archaeon]|nr:cytochrome c biogenesis protein CcsA [Candidatus Bathyarchaeota archaeon]
MEFGTVFLVVAAVLLVSDFLVSALSKRNGKLESYGLLASVVTFALIAVSYVLFLEAFVGNNFSFVEVYSYSSSSLPVMSKIYASWGGARGSMLFLTLILGLFYMALRFQAYRKKEKFNITTSQIFSLIVIVFLIICLVRNPFEQFATVPLEGRGLNPQLQTFWMAIHPPIVFAAYAFVLLAYTLTLASMKNSRELENSNLFKFSTYMAWILLTVGIALGGVWAYEVLGWGGYWAWDPVETASLLPWLFLTAYFLFRSLFKKASYTKEFMILLIFTSLVFLSALTRGGFTQSVHSYAISPVAPIMMIFSFAMISYFFHLKKSKKQSLFKLETGKEAASKSGFLGFWAIMAIALVCFVGLAFQDFAYNSWTFPFVMVLVASIIGCCFDKKTPFIRLLLIALVSLGVGGLMVLLQFPDINPLATLSLPLLCVAFLAVVYKLIKVSIKKSSRQFGHSLVYLGIIVLLIGVFVSAGAKNTQTLNDLAPNKPAEELGVKIEISNFTVSISESKVYNEQIAASVPEYSTIRSDITIQYLGETYQSSLLANFYPNYGLVLRPTILSTPSGDVYLHFEYTEALYESLTQTLNDNNTLPRAVSVTVQTSPMIYLVWIGAGVIVASMALQVILDMKLKHRKTSN